MERYDTDLDHPKKRTDGYRELQMHRVSPTVALSIRIPKSPKTSVIWPLLHVDGRKVNLGVRLDRGAGNKVPAFAATVA